MAHYVNYTITEEQGDGSTRVTHRAAGPYDSWQEAREHAQDIGTYINISGVEISGAPRKVG